MKKLLVLLFSIMISINSYAEVPTHIGGNTIKDICDVSGCSEGISAYYHQNYLTKRKHKALAVSVRGNGKGIDGIYAGWYFQSSAEVRVGVLKYCKREGGRNCKVLLLDDRIYDKNLYKQLTTKSIPRNAYSSGNTWKCNSGYKKSGNGCIKKVVIPVNAYSFGNSWKCDNGYKKSGSRCTKIFVPQNAYLSGASWECNTGFIKDGNRCLKTEESIGYMEELKKVKDLFDSGIINADDFEKLKQKIIDKI
jgi:hypothetical protein